MLEAVLVLGGLGFAAAVGLGAASLRFRVEVDDRVEELERALPGVNCGACGYAGCGALARALAGGKAPANACVPGGADVAAAVARILGVDAGETVYSFLCFRTINTFEVIRFWNSTDRSWINL